MTASLRRVVDAVVAVLLVLLALVPLQPAFDDPAFWLALAGGVVVGTGVALLGDRWKTGPAEVAALALGGYFLFGGLFAVRSDAIVGAIPSLATLRDLALGIVFSWKQLLTIQAPVTGFDQLLVVPYLAALVGTVLAVSFALRLNRYGFTLLPIGLLLAGAIAFGTHEPLLPALVGGLTAAVSLGWVAWRQARARTDAAHAELLGQSAGGSSAVLRRTVWAVSLALLAGTVGMGVASATATSDRVVLREVVVPPLELHDYPSPLMSFRKYVTDGADTTLFTVDGLPAGQRLRLATMDLYDGVVYKVSGSGGAGAGTFSRVGQRIAGAPAGSTATVRVTIGELRGVWLPDVGYLSGLWFEGDRAVQLTQGLHYNRVTGTAVTTAGLQPGDGYTFEATLAEPVTPAELAAANVDESIELPSPEKLPDVLSGVTAQKIGQSLTPIQKVTAIQDFLKQGFFSHGLDTDSVESPSGHSQWRLSRMFEVEQLLGDQEQYAVAMALMAAQSGIPARVVMGFVQPAADGPVAVTGEDVSAWVEIPIEGHGWVAFDPTPTNDPKNMQQIQEKRSKPRSSLPQPPPPPEEPPQLPPEPPVEQEAEDELGPDDAGLWRTVLYVGGGTLAGLTILLGPGLVMLGLKARRRSRRKLAPALPDRVRGGWDEVVDSAADLGVRVPPVTTRRENSRLLEQSYPALGLITLAARADQAVFGEGEPGPDEVAVYWADVETARRRIAGQASFRQRLRRFFAPPSLLGRGRR